ncbi:hypothetical protein ACFYV7_14810 [Nocardia suismassiliense]|uniref:Uncharacterized protein n=1 Tax=Nocardia suismassiliense TaxID=2077092 RepID=A0ABW6QS64_9NOCA
MSPRQTVNIGVAAHIYAAASGGPRGAGGLSATERSEPENGIWCCFKHGKAIDSDGGRIYSAADLQAWKRLHEARKAAEVNGAPLHNIGLVESISVNSAPVASLEGRTFDLAMRNVFIGPSASGKSVLTRLIASVSYPDHVADMSRCRDVDMAVRWFDPHTHDVITTGRRGQVTHVLDGRPVPYVARPYKTILLNGMHRNCVGNIVKLAHTFDLSVSAMKGTLSLLCSQSNFVRAVHYEDTRVRWVLDINGRILDVVDIQWLGNHLQSSILLEVAGIHAQLHAHVEPTFLLIDELLDFYRHPPSAQVDVLDRLQRAAEHAQVAIVGHSIGLVEAASSGWTVTAMEYHPSTISGGQIDFEVAIEEPNAEKQLSNRHGHYAQSVEPPGQPPT